jgi:hypothetical protein
MGQLLALVNLFRAVISLEAAAVVELTIQDNLREVMAEGV